MLTSNALKKPSHNKDGMGNDSTDDKIICTNSNVDCGVGQEHDDEQWTHRHQCPLMMPNPHYKYLMHIHSFITQCTISVLKFLTISSGNIPQKLYTLILCSTLHPVNFLCAHFHPHTFQTY